MMNESTGLTAADIAAVTNNGGMFGNGSDGWWILLLFLFWGNRGGYGMGGGNGYPCATQADVRAAVDQQTLISKLDNAVYGLADSTYAINNAITGGFHGVDRGLCDLSHQISDCCCTTKQAIADVKYTIAQEGCDTRNTIQNTTRDIIDNANANSRAILDFLVQDKLASKDARISQLENKLSQSEQNAFISATIDASQATLIRRLGADCPVPAYVVPNPNCCYQPVGFSTCNSGCGGGF